MGKPSPLSIWRAQGNVIAGDWANPGVEYLVYQPEQGDFTVDLKSGTYDAEWFDPIGGVVVKKEAITTKGGRHS